MEYRTLGRTNLKVSTIGIGAGGPSRLGQRNGQEESDSVNIVRQALEAGINFIDTAEAYRTEDIVGKAIQGYDRDALVISTKKRTWSDDKPITPDDVNNSLDDSLRRLQTDYIDIYHLHGVKITDYDYLLNEIVPVMQRHQQHGKIRFIGITEAWNSDKEHETLIRALQDDVWDVMMVGFNLLNQTARQTILPHTIEQNIGVLIMFAVRLALSKPERLQPIIQDLIDSGEVHADDFDLNDPLGFLTDTGIASTVTEAAYRFCNYEPGVHVTLSGTGSPVHLQQNIDTFTKPPLPDDTVARLKSMFANVTSVTGQ